MRPIEKKMLADLHVIVGKIRLATMCGWSEKREILLTHYLRVKRDLIALRIRRSQDA